MRLSTQSSSLPDRSLLTMLASLSGTRLQAGYLWSSRGFRLTVPLHAQGKRLLTTASPRHVTNLSSQSHSPGRIHSGSTWHKGPLPAHTRTALPSLASLSPLRSYATNNADMSDIKIKVGDTIPQGTFTYIPWSPELEDHSACGIRAY